MCEALRARHPIEDCERTGRDRTSSLLFMALGFLGLGPRRTHGAPLDVAEFRQALGDARWSDAGERSDAVERSDVIHDDAPGVPAGRAPVEPEWL